MRTQAGMAKNLSKKSGKRKRNLKKWKRVTHKGTLKMMKRLLPYWKIKTANRTD